jgi:mannitol-1-phosphate 5-dehydrogenase
VVAPRAHHQQGVKWVDDLQPYIERKLYAVNTGHAATAYCGYSRGKKAIAEALDDSFINKEVQKASAETATLTVKKHKIEPNEQKTYVEKTVERISNPQSGDTVVRFGRAPLRKLSGKERFIGSSQLVEYGYAVDALLGAITVAFKFQNV